MQYDDEPSLNIPSLLTLAVVSFFVLRWFFNRDDSSAGNGRPRGRGNAVDPAQVEQISQMFPQLSTREIMWDLQRNGGSVAATTERILTGRGLEMVRLVLCCGGRRCLVSRRHFSLKDIVVFSVSIWTYTDRRIGVAPSIIPTPDRASFPE